MSKKRPHGPPKAEPCSRPIEAQWVDRTGVKRADHPRTALQRIDLSEEKLLDDYRARFPQRFDEALETYDELDLELDARLPDILRIASQLAPDIDELKTGYHVPSVVFCQACGAHAVVSAFRTWAVHRLMQRTRRSERTVVRAVALLEAALDLNGAVPDLGKLSGGHVDDLHRLFVDEATDFRHVATRFAFASRAAG